jgi:hypothetical protein
MDARTVLARKGSLRRAKSGRALAHCAPFRRFKNATGGSGGMGLGGLFFNRRSKSIAD